MERAQLDRLHRPVLISTNACGVIAGANCATTYDGPEDRRLGHRGCLAPRLARDEGTQSAQWCADGFRFWSITSTACPSWSRRACCASGASGRRIGRAAGARPAAARARRRAASWALIAGAAIGIAALRRRREPLGILLVPAAVVTLAAATGWGLASLRVAAEVPLVVLAGAGAIAALGGLPDRPQRDRAPRSRARRRRGARCCGM